MRSNEEDERGHDHPLPARDAGLDRAHPLCGCADRRNRVRHDPRLPHPPAALRARAHPRPGWPARRRPDDGHGAHSHRVGRPRGRIGEKWVISGGLALTALAALGATTAPGYVSLGLFLLLGGAASASTNSASGKVVVGWFPRDRRGLAMGIRQMAQPLGVTVAAVTVPTIAAAGGIGAALVVPLVLTAVLAVACAIGIVN